MDELYTALFSFVLFDVYWFPCGETNPKGFFTSPFCVAEPIVHKVVDSQSNGVFIHCSVGNRDRYMTFY